jgi:hypothetical protein
VTAPVPNSPSLPTTVSAQPGADPQAILEGLLYSVSHDLRSPLLTMSLSTDLIEDALRSASGDASVTIALDALRHGAKDMERMLQALTVLSRAYRGTIESARAPLRIVLAGHLVISDASDLDGVLVTVDPLVVREILDIISGDGTVEVHVRLHEGYALVEVAAPEMQEGATSPLGSLISSLTYGAGTSIEALAARQILVERQGGRVTWTTIACVSGCR